MTKPGADREWPFAEGGGTTMAIITLIWVAIFGWWKKRPKSFRGVIAGIFTLLTGLIFYFFRDPKRPLPSYPGLVVSPGDGKVVNIVQEQENTYLHQEVIRISIFLSILDVHVQRMPIEGKIQLIEHRSGKFLQAFLPEASDVNEHIAMIISSPYGLIEVKQIAGILARRCVNYAKIGESYATGERFGMIRFSSRVDLFLPVEADILVTVGEQVYGGLTPIAQFSRGG